MSVAAHESESGRQLTLCFHGIGIPGRALEPGEERFWISVAQFEGILDAVAAHSSRVGLTFDDSNESDYTIAHPALLHRGLDAEFFVITNRIGRAGSLSAPQISGLHASGMTIGTHGMTHASWRSLSLSHEFERELADSARMLEAITQTPVRVAACPRGQYDRRVLAELKARGFTRVYSVDGGRSRPAAWLRTRYTAIYSDSAASITDLLNDEDQLTGARALRDIRETVKRWR